MGLGRELRKILRIEFFMEKKVNFGSGKRLKMRFGKYVNKQIFLYITLGFILGIFSFSYIPPVFSDLIIFLTLITIPLFFAMPLRQNGLSTFLLIFLFFGLGYQLTLQRVEPITQQNFEERYLSGDIVEGKVLEISESEKLWNKAIIKLNYVYRFGEKIPLDEPVLFLVNENAGIIEKGDCLLLNAPISPIANKGNPGEFDAESYWKSKGISNLGFLLDDSFVFIGKEENGLLRWFHKIDKLLSDLFEQKLHPESVGIAKALVLGDRDHLDSEAVNAFGKSGAMHVLAVSGLHVGLILALLIYVLSLFPKWISKYQATIIALIIIWLYALLTGFSPSVFRAVVMFSLLTLAKLTGKNYNSLNVLMISVIILLLFNPLLLFDLGFQLSYLAMLGILLLYKPIFSFWYISHAQLRKIWEGTAIGLAAQVFTLPLTLYCFHQFPNYFLVTNIGLMVLTNLVLIAGVVLIVLNFVPFISWFVAWILSIAVLIMFWFVQWIEHLPASTATGFTMGFGEVFILYSIIIVILLSWQLKRKGLIFGTILLLVTCGFLVNRRWLNAETNEFVVFNESNLTFCVKMNDEIYCFYERKDKLQRSKFVVESYQKIRPARVKYVELNEGKFELRKENFEFCCQNKNSFYEVKINDKSWKIVKQVTIDNAANLKEDAIYMPWLRFEKSEGHVLFNEGAFVYRI